MEKDLLERLQVAREKVNIVEEGQGIWRSFFVNQIRSKSSESEVCKAKTNQDKNSQVNSQAESLQNANTFQPNTTQVKAQVEPESSEENSLTSSRKVFPSKEKISEEKFGAVKLSEANPDEEKTCKVKVSETKSCKTKSSDLKAEGALNCAMSSSLGKLTICKEQTSTTFCGSTPFCKSTTSFFTENDNKAALSTTVDNIRKDSSKVTSKEDMQKEIGNGIDYFPVLQCFVKIVVEFLKYEKPFLQLSSEIKEQLVRNKICEMVLILIHLFYSSDKKQFTFPLTAAETNSFHKLFGIQKDEAIITQAHLEVATNNSALIKNLISSLDVISSVGFSSSKLVSCLLLIFYSQDEIDTSANIRQIFGDRFELCREDLSLEEDKLSIIMQEVNNFKEQNDMEFIFG